MSKIQIRGLQKTSLIDFSPHIATTIFLPRCNFRCGYCYNPDLVLNYEKMPGIDEDETIEMLKSRLKWIEGVCITGGEPTLHDGLAEFIKKIKKIGLLVKVDTNGTNPKKIKELIDGRLVDYIAMDIKGPLDKYDEIANVKVDKKAIEESMKLLKENKVDYEFRTTIVKELLSKKDLIKIGEWLKGSKRYYLQQFAKKGELVDPKFKDKTAYPPNELKKFAKLLEKYFDEVGVRGIT